MSAETFRDALGKTVHNVDHLVDLIASTLGLDHDRVFMGRYALPVLGRLLLKNNGRFTDAAEAGRALYWYVHAAVRGRFAGSTETSLARISKPSTATGSTASSKACGVPATEA